MRDEFNINKVNVLVTGGAGFIGSNLLDALMEDERVGKVRVLDNLSTGSLENIQHLMGRSDFEFVEADVRDYRSCLEACHGMDLLSHQAALGSVPRSLADPLSTNAVNITGSLNMLQAARESGIRRVVYAASSSTYGDSTVSPKKEDNIGKPLSPYAVTKYVNELYASVYHRAFGLEVIGLRYFNVFGPRQSPGGAYAAAIPLFIRQLMEDQAPTINGDGSNSRDFTFVENVVQANLLALFTPSESAIGQVFNVACGEETSLLELFEILRNLLGKNIEPHFGPERFGDIRHSLADISRARNILGYTPGINVSEGLKKTVQWHQEQSFIR